MDSHLSNASWVCVRQRAGPFVKAFSTDNRRFLKKCSFRSLAPALCGKPVERLELLMALFGYDGIHYVLTFSEDNCPETLEQTKRIWSCFLRRLKRWRKGKPFDFYIYRIEGLHGDHRWHIHAFIRDQDFPPAVMRYLWTWGNVEDFPYNLKRLLCGDGQKGFYDLAKYFVKEPVEVGRHAWGSSRTLRGFLPPPQIRRSETGRISIPRNAILLPCDKVPKLGKWGVFQYARYLLPENSALYLNSRI